MIGKFQKYFVFLKKYLLIVIVLLNRYVNSQIKSGDWRKLWTPDSDIPTAELADLIGEVYDLDRAIVQRLEFSFVTYVGNKGNTKIVVLDKHQAIRGIVRHDRSPAVLPAQLGIDDVKLRVRMEVGDKIERDCSCDSKYMLSAMDRVGAAVRKSFSWIPPEENCYIVMDNAGGHGTDDAIVEYTNMLKEKYKIKIIHQVPRSPYTNLLDLGVWMSLQSQVEKEHYMKRTDVDALVNTVKQTWTSQETATSLNSVIGKVWGRLRNVLVLIVEGKGGNDLVETKRGKKFRNLDLPAEFLAAKNPNLNDPPPPLDSNTNNELFFDLVVDDEEEEVEF